MKDLAKKFFEKTEHSVVFSILVLVAAVVSFRGLPGQVTWLERSLLYVLAFLGAWNIKSILLEIRRRYSGILDRIVLALVCLLSTFCETGAFFIVPRFLQIPFPVFFAVSLLWVSVIVLYLVCKSCHMIESLSRCREGKSFSWKESLIMVAVCVGLCMLCVYAFNPAITSMDSLDCLNYAYHLGEGPIPNGHPVFYLLLLRFFSSINGNLQFLILVQAVYYALVYTCGMNTLVQIGVPKKVCAGIYLLAGIGFNTIIQLATLWKDIPFATSFLWLTILLVQMCARPEKYAKCVSWYVQYAVSAILTGLIRHNGLLPVIATLVLSLLLLREKKRLLVATLAVCLAITVISGPVYSRYQVYDVPGLKFYAMANDIMNVYYFEGGDDKFMQVVNDVTDGDPENFNYNPYYTKVARNNMDHYSIPEFLDIYLYTWLHYPKTMLRGFLARNSVIWSIGRAFGEERGCVNYLGEYRNPDLGEPYPERVPNAATEIVTKISEKLTSNGMIYTFYWKTAIYNLLMVIGLLFILLRYRRNFLSMALPFVPIAVNVFALLMTSGWPDYRYYWPSFLTASMLLPYTAIVLAEKKR